MLVKRTRANQITIPKKIMQSFENAAYFDVQQRGTVIVLKPVEIQTGETILPRIRAKMKALSITPKDINEAIRSVRASNDKSRTRH